ncbi:(2Fe-2S)-binding protein [Leifsonia sp. F6_8S_P_1B]|uniref:(2Fe-2S)-binding protein n=1 Tax=Leifsonia williamsii TaxID=3035919 RepID=A0ABT8KCA4_9MICO|nr:(2Fe-2S)-binding protein [Leifsonia williamsii]MDN4614593.1 (2Fe-2S)-binding protein [Leifsonia williamsii]
MSDSSGLHATRLPGGRGEPIEITVDGERVACFAGETVAAALLAAGVPEFSRRGGEPRLPLCNMGTCFECGVTVDGVPLTRACLLAVSAGMTVETSRA